MEQIPFSQQQHNNRIPNPEAGAAYNFGWNVTMKFFLDLLLLIILTGIISTPFMFWGEFYDYNHFSDYNFNNNYDDISFSMYNGFHGIYSFIYGILIAGPFEYGVIYAFYIACKNKRPMVQYIFEPFKNYWNVVLANLLVTTIIGLGFVFLIVPGIIFACRLAFVPFLVVDRKLDAVTAVRESWRMTSPYAWTIFGMGILAFFVGLLGLIAFFVGVIVSIMVIHAAFAALYLAAETREKEFQRRMI